MMIHPFKIIILTDSFTHSGSSFWWIILSLGQLTHSNDESYFKIDFHDFNYFSCDNFFKAVLLFNRSINSQSEWRQMHHVCFWELMFCHAYLRQWDRSAYYASLLLQENKWSRASYSYMCAVFTLASFHQLIKNSSKLDAHKHLIGQAENFFK